MKPPWSAASPHPSHGGYEDLKSFQIAETVFDFTKAFCYRFTQVFTHQQPEKPAEGL